jgi:lactoylglutathione lyase
LTTFPIIYVSDVERSARFYEEAFGFERTFVWDEPDGVFIALRRRGSELGIGEGEGRGGFELCIYVDDVDATAARLRELGAHEVAPPEDKPWNERMAFFDDPDGHRLHVTMSLCR